MRLVIVTDASGNVLRNVFTMEPEAQLGSDGAEVFELIDHDGIPIEDPDIKVNVETPEFERISGEGDLPTATLARIET